MASKCTLCGTEIPELDTLCARCAAGQIHSCSHCGIPIPLNELLCYTCEHEYNEMMKDLIDRGLVVRKEDGTYEATEEGLRLSREQPPLTGLTPEE